MCITGKKQKLYLIFLMDKPDIKLANRILLQKEKFPRFRNPDSITRGEKIHDMGLDKGFKNQMFPSTCLSILLSSCEDKNCTRRYLIKSPKKVLQRAEKR